MIVVVAASGTVIGPVPRALLLLMKSEPLLNVVPRLKELLPVRVTEELL